MNDAKPLASVAPKFPQQPVQMWLITYEDQGGGNVLITGYRNDVQIGQYTDNPFATWTAGNAEIILGKRHGAANSPGPGALDARIEEVRIYDTALSAQEISQLTNQKEI